MEILQSTIVRDMGFSSSNISSIAGRMTDHDRIVKLLENKRSDGNHPAK